MNTNQDSYKLTRYPIGSLRELFVLAAPLMIGFFSMNLIFIVERLVMSHISVGKMNAVAHGGMLFWAAVVFFWIFADTVEILVGKYNGAGELKKVAAPVWQALWTIIFVLPLFSVLLYAIAPYIVTGENAEDKIIFFRTVICFTPFFVAPIAFQTFFIGTGRTKLPTIMMIVTNVINIALSLLFVLVFYWDILGIGLAAGITNVLMCIIWFFLFTTKKNRETYGSGFQKFQPEVFKELFTLATPSAMAKTLECLAHAVFYSIIASVSTRTMTMATICQTILIFVSFMVEGTSKGSGAVLSNLVGAKKFHLIPKVLFTGFFFHVISVVLVGTFLFLLQKPIVVLFTSSSETYRNDPQFLPEFSYTLLALCFFFLIDGFAWILFNLLAAFNDTKFVFYVNAFFNWVAYVLPVYIFVWIYHYGSACAWTICAICNLFIFISYYLRYKEKMGVYNVSLQMPQEVNV